MKRIWSWTEVRLALFGVVLHGAWEFLHSPLYEDHTIGWFYVLWTRLHCTVGDVMILLFTFWLTSLLVGNRRWLERFQPFPVAVFTLSGMAYTTYSEWYNVYVAGHWSYTDSMPELLGIGVTPLLQWLILPPLIGLFLRETRRRSG